MNQGESFVKKDKTNWIYLAVVFVSAAITGACLITYINSDTAQGADDMSYSRPTN